MTNELNDTDSFNDLNDDDIFQDDPFEFQPTGSHNLTSSNNNNRIRINNNHNGLIDRVKTWWNTRSLTQSRLDKLNDRGIPLYDLDSNGNPRLHDDGSNDSFEPVPYPSQFLSSSHWNFNSKFTKREKFAMLFKLLKWLVILGLVIALILHVIAEIITAKNNHPGTIKDGNASNIFNKGKNQFNPNKLYNNGTHDFYPLTFVINLRYMSPELISHDETPFLYNMIYPHENELDVVENDTLISVLQPNFPFESIVQDWSMITGQFPLNNGVINSENFDKLTINNVTLPIWDNINQSYSGKYRMKSYGWSHIDMNDIHDLKHKDSKAKIQDIIEKIDEDDYKIRPELIFLCLNDLKDSVDNGKKIENEKHILNMDKLIRKLIYELRHRNLLDFTNIIILSDSGIDNKVGETIRLESLLNKDEDKGKYKKLIKSINKIDLHEGRMISLQINDINDRNIIFKILKDNINPDEISLYIRDKLPLQYHFQLNKFKEMKNKLIDNIWLVPKDGYTITHNNIGKSHKECLFIGKGPYFSNIVNKRLNGNKWLNKFNNIVIYDIISSIIGLKGQNKNKGRDSYKIEIIDKLSDYRETSTSSRRKESSSSSSSSSSTYYNSAKSSTIIISTRITSSSTKTVKEDKIIPTSTRDSSNNWNQYFNEDNLHSMIDKLKDTEEDILNNVNDMINGLMKGGGDSDI